MRLRSLRRHWERLGRRDPLWAVLTDPHKREGGWDLEEFFRSGKDEIAAALQRGAELGLAVSRRRALDFGCGVGRLTQAMAAEFERCDGVDISASMLQAARRYNRSPERCTYHHNVAPDLALFADASFTFVYPTLVLQHMAPEHSTRYIQELVRVLAPGGLLVFQLPSRRSHEQAADATHTPASRRLPPDAYQARLIVEPNTRVMRAGELSAVSVLVENRSPHAWPAAHDGWGRFQINLANHWLDEDGELLQRDDGRCPLPHDLAPGSRVELTMSVTAPLFDGAYLLEFDLVQEDVAWFSQRGSEVARISCRVEGGRPGPHPRIAVPVLQPDLSPEPPFRERHPRLFGALSATGLRDVYWRWRRAKDRVKRRRDLLIVRCREVAYQPVVPPLINWWNNQPFAARMRMFCVPRAEVLAIIHECGGRAVLVGEETLPGGFESCRYWVTKQGAAPA